MKDNVSIFTKIYSIIIILLPFLYQYASPLSFLSLGDFILLIFTVYGLLRTDFVHAIKCIKPIIVYAGSFCVLTIFVSLFSGSYFEYSDALTIFFKILLYLCVCVVCTQHFDLRFVKKIYFVLVGLFSVYLLIQVVYHKISGGFLPIFLKYEWLFSWEQRSPNLSDFYVTGYYTFRPSSLFLEPGYYALYVLPALFLLLFEDRRIIASVLLYCAILLSTSGAGILIGALAFFLKAMTYVAYFKDGKIYFTPYMIVFILLLAAVLIYLLGVNREILPKLFNSFNARITRGLLVFEKTDPFHRIFGVGMNNLENYMNAYKIYTQYDEENLNFGASIVAAIVQYGIVGFVIFLASLLMLFVYLRSSKMGALLVSLYIIYTIFEEVIFNFRMGFLLAFVIYYISRSGRCVHVRAAIGRKRMSTVRG